MQHRTLDLVFANQEQFDCSMDWIKDSDVKSTLLFLQKVFTTKEKLVDPTSNYLKPLQKELESRPDCVRLLSEYNESCKAILEHKSDWEEADLLTVEFYARELLRKNLNDLLSSERAKAFQPAFCFKTVVLDWFDGMIDASHLDLKALAIDNDLVLEISKKSGRRLRTIGLNHFDKFRLGSGYRAGIQV